MSEQIPIISDDWLAIAYTEYGKWYEIPGVGISIRDARQLHYNDIITMIQKRKYTLGSNNKLVPTSVIELWIRKKRG
jgi:hypothetical protein